MNIEGLKIVVLGGGTGTSTVLRALKTYPVKLAAVVSMADDGGSTGLLRKELGVLPPGDIRQCLLALSGAENAVKELFDTRFSTGGLSGHSAGNLLLAMLERQMGSFEEAVAVASRMLKVEGEVIPVTLNATTLGVIHGADKIRVMGEHVIDDGLILGQPREFFLEPRANISDRARKAIVDADCIILGPGSLATSLIPVLIVDGVKEAIAESKAKLVYNVNLAPTPGQTDDYSPQDYAADLEQYLPRPFDKVIYDESLIDSVEVKQKAGDAIKRASVRHNPAALGKVIMDYLAAL